MFVRHEINTYIKCFYQTGRDNLIKAGIINKYNGFRDLYDEDESPEVTLEFTYAFRWFHLLQPTTAKYVNFLITLDIEISNRRK